MRGAVLVAIAASIGNMLQGWDNATIAGSLLYIKKEFNLQSEPTIEGLIVAMSLIGATVITTFSGPLSDSVGRRPMLIASSILYFLSGLVMSWSPNVYALLVARLLDGFGVGLAVTLVPVYISETAPPEIRGLLNTLPQFLGCAGMFVSYCVVFGMSLTDAPSWRLMLGFLSIPSLAYMALTVLFLPESPRWLVTKGRMEEAKRVLQQLSGKQDVSGEMALLVEGLGVGGNTCIEEYIIAPVSDFSDNQEHAEDKEQIKIYGSNDGGASWIAKPVSADAPISRYGSIATQSMSFVDPTVNLFGSIHEKFHPDTGSRLSSFIPNFGSAFNVTDNHGKPEDWDEVREAREGDDRESSSSSSSGSDSDENLRSPLLSPHDKNAEKDPESQETNGGGLNARLHSSLMQANAGEAVDGMDIGGGWQLAYKYAEDGEKAGELQRIYLHQEGNAVSRRGSIIQLCGDHVHAAEGDQSGHAAALISRSMLQTDLTGHVPLEGDIVLPSKTAAKGPSWVDLFEPGVKHALVVGVGLQILQQFSGINGVLYYTPQILEQAGVGVLLSDMGIRPDSASLLISAVTSLLMLPTIGVAMRLMDAAGRRWLLLSTLPVLLLSLVVLVLGSVIPLSEVFHAVIATVSVVVYFCTFVMGFGPIPNILCSEIFPTRVRGYCIAICALTFWICDIIVTYSLPVMLNSVGLGGVFAMYAVVCAIAWVFVFLKVPETKGMPLEVITEFFAVGAKQAADAAKKK